MIYVVGTAKKSVARSTYTVSQQVATPGGGVAFSNQGLFGISLKFSWSSYACVLSTSDAVIPKIPNELIAGSLASKSPLL